MEQLRHFLKVAELENFTRAAEQVELTQSSLSRSIARLEEELGQPLFDRQSRKVVLNDAGRLLLDHARNIIIMAEDAKAEIGDDGQSGKIRVAAIPTIAPYFLPECLKSFRDHYPQAQVIVHEDTTENLLKKIADGEVDIAIAALPIVAKHVDVVPLFDEELLLVTSKDHPLARKKAVRAADIEELPFVLLGEAHCLSDNVISFCRQKSFHPVSVERTCQLSMIQELVALGHGISLVPAMASARDDSKSRVYRSLTGPKPTRTIAMVSNPYRFHSQLVRRFQEHLKLVR
ncbi:MAG TPA: LysR family transcriptional regulator [Gemmatales bacterium]|nr:LysR family transcriptional regulator [Gemmatales bacterium]